LFQRKSEEADLYFLHRFVQEVAVVVAAAAFSKCCMLYQMTRPQEQ